MKRTVAIAFMAAILAIAGAATGQSSGLIVLWAEESFTSCNVAGATDLVTIYVVHEYMAGATSSRFKLQDNTGGALAYVGDQVQPPVVALGNANTGVDLAYGACFTGKLHILNAVYSVLSDPPVCSTIQVVPDPAAPSGWLEGTDCQGVRIFPGRTSVTFNNEGTCACQWDGLPIETSTWGNVKSLYR